jgi:hypothetical protein
MVHRGVAWRDTTLHVEHRSNAWNQVSAAELARRSGATYRQIDYWVRTGLLDSRQDGFGSGFTRWFDISEIPVAVALAQASRFIVPARRTYTDVADATRAGLDRIERDGATLSWTPVP